MSVIGPCLAKDRSLLSSSVLVDLNCVTATKFASGSGSRPNHFCGVVLGAIPLVHL